MSDSLREQCYQRLVQWHFEQHQRPLGPANRFLYDRVTEVLSQARERTVSRGRGALEGIIIALANEIRGVAGRQESSERPS